MIKDNYLNQDFSDYGGDEQSFLINSKYFQGNISENIEGFFSKTKIGYYIIEQDYFEENAYPYQGLLLSYILSQNLTDAILIDQSQNKSILTVVKDKKPIFSSFANTVESSALEEQIKRIVTSYTLNENAQIINIDKSIYNTSLILSTFQTAEEILQKQKVSLLKGPVLFLASFVFLCYYCITNIPDTLNHDKINKEIKALELKKQQLYSKQVQSNQSKHTLNYQTLYSENKKTEQIIDKLQEIIKKEPSLKIKEVDNAGSIIVTDFSSKYKENLKNLSRVTLCEKGLIIEF